MIFRTSETLVHGRGSAASIFFVLFHFTFVLIFQFSNNDKSQAVRPRPFGIIFVIGKAPAIFQEELACAEAEAEHLLQPLARDLVFPSGVKNEPNHCFGRF